MTSDSGILRSVAAVLVLTLAVLAGAMAHTHPVPDTIMALGVYEDRVEADLAIPLSELMLAFDLDEINNASAVAAQSERIADYLLAHTGVTGPDGTRWNIFADRIAIDEGVTAEGAYFEVTARLVFTPPSSRTEDFVLDYHVILHQVVTHRVLVSIRQDWMSGLNYNGEAEGGVSQLGVITANPTDGTIAPFAVDLGDAARPGSLAPRHAGSR